MSRQTAARGPVTPYVKNLTQDLINRDRQRLEAITGRVKADNFLIREIYQALPMSEAALARFFNVPKAVIVKVGKVLKKRIQRVHIKNSIIYKVKE